MLFLLQYVMIDSAYNCVVYSFYLQIAYTAYATRMAQKYYEQNMSKPLPAETAFKHPEDKGIYMANVQLVYLTSSLFLFYEF